MALIIISFDEPVLSVQLAIDAIESLVALALEGHVPFVSRPTIVPPPITGGSPWTSQSDNFSIDTALLAPGADLRWTTLIGFDNCLQRWTIATKAQGLLIADCRLPVAAWLLSAT